ncbi:MAG: ABC transporter ATP-binding protein [Oscillospiraceae bacterium]
MSENILEIRHLKTSFFTENGELRAVDDMSYSVRRGEFCAIIGESGSGKSVSALSVMRLVSYPPGFIKGGEIIFDGRDLMDVSDREMESIRGSEIAMIFQEPGTALNPVMTIGSQIEENILLHNDVSREEARRQAEELLAMVDIPNPGARLKDYPHQFSGGMKQRAMIAMAMSCKPKLLFADEPTTALDVTVQAQVLEQLNAMRDRFGTSLVLITHNLGVVARYADSVKIMYGGRIVESGSAEDIFDRPAHPYTMGLIRAVPRLDLPRSHGLYTIEGEPPDMSKTPSDCCPFHYRCPYAADECIEHRPPDEEVSEGHICACFRRELAAESWKGADV